MKNNAIEPYRTKVCDGYKVEEFYIMDRPIVFINDMQTYMTFEQACETFKKR